MGKLSNPAEEQRRREKERQVKKVRLLLWMTGTIGCVVLLLLFFEIS